MKKHTSLTPKQLLFACLALLIFSLLTLFLFSYRRDEKRFLHLSNQIFLEEMQANTLNMHYTLASPEDFGIYHYTPTLPCYSAQGRATSQALTENTISTLRTIRVEHLSPQDAYACQLLLRTLENSLEKGRFPYYDEPLSPHSGVQSQFPILMAEYIFRSKRDVEDYLALLSQTDTYFASLLTFQQEKAAAGLLMPASSLKKVIEQCDTIVTSEQIAAGTHFLQTTFQERLDGLLEQHEITLEEQTAYLAQHQELLEKVLLPAYTALADGLFVLLDETIPLGGLASHPDGVSYYEALLISETGSYRSVPDVKQMLSKQFDLEYQTIHSMLAQHPELMQWYQNGETIDFPLTDGNAMLADLQKRMEEDFPLLADQTVPTPQATIKSVSPSLEDYCAPAFYLTTPIDDTDNNVIYINEKNSPSGLELYTTLAHEGYPGHLYQNVYCNQVFAAQEENMLRELLWYGGYLEGWALYTEFISFDYASALLQEEEQALAALDVQLEKHNRSLQLCLYSLLDIMIHYENASFQQVSKVLENFGIKDSNSAARVYTYIAEEPCNYLKYYLGYMEIMELQEKAKSLWGSAYSPYAFHRFLLDCGPSDFLLLEERLEAYEIPSPTLSYSYRRTDSGFPKLSAVLPALPGSDSLLPHLSSADGIAGAEQRHFFPFR